MTRKLFLASLLAALFWIVLLAFRTEKISVAATGTVKAGFETLGSATAQLERDGELTDLWAHTDSNGRYSLQFNIKENGDFHIHISKEGYTPYRISSVAHPNEDRLYKLPEITLLQIPTRDRYNRPVAHDSITVYRLQDLNIAYKVAVDDIDYFTSIKQSNSEYLSSVTNTHKVAFWYEVVFVLKEDEKYQKDAEVITHVGWMKQ